MSSVKHKNIILENTGILKGLGDISIKTSDDTTRFIIDNTTGNVGIGTTTTTDKLHVVGDATITGALTVNGSPIATSQWENGTAGEIYYNTANVGIGSTEPTQKLDVDGNALINGFINANSLDTPQIYSSGDLSITPSANTLITSGNVGIGLSNPQRNLDIKGSAAKIGLFGVSENDSVTLFLSNPVSGDPTESMKTSIISEGGLGYSRSKLHFCLNNNSDDNTSAQDATVSHARMTITPEGNVGIGSTNPAQKLDINGNVKASGYVSSPNIVTESGDLQLTPAGNNVIVNNKNLGVGIEPPSGERLYVEGVTRINDNTSSTSPTTGALQISGGVGISATDDAVSLGNGGALTIAGGISVAKKSFFGDEMNLQGNLTANSGETSTSTTTGALRVSGGVGITENLHVGGTLSVASMTSTPAISSITAISNCSTISTSNILRKRLLKINNERILSLVISVEPDSITTTTSFRFPVPDITEFTSLDQLVPSIYGLSTETSPMVNVENCTIYPSDIVDPETNEITVSFTSSTQTSDTVLLYINITYSTL